MRNIRIFTGALIIIFTVLTVYLYLVFEKSNQSNYSPEPLAPGEYMAHQRMYPTGNINTSDYHAGMDQAGILREAKSQKEYTWEFAGPTNIGGRITDIEIPYGSPETIYLGAATGGLWKSTDMGISWDYKFNGVTLISVGDIAIDPANDNILYVGTGEANASSYSFIGDGIYKSTDGGDTWGHSGLENSAYIGRIIVDHSNSNRLWAAACGNLFTPDPERGLYRSEDAGASWEKVLFINDSTSAIDVVQHPLNQDIIYAAMWERMRGLTYRHSFGDGSGIFKSEDGGDTWTELVTGLPTGDAGRIGLTISHTNPNVLYAFYDMPYYEVKVYKTNNGGLSWSQTNDGALDGMNSSFGWYFGQVRVDPGDENNVFVMGVSLFKSANGGNSWNELGGWDLHVDHHAMFFDETNNRIFLGNDGGLYYSTNNGSSWNKINNLPFTQFYAIDVDYNNPARIIGGTQDNNTIINYDGSTDNWTPILGGDGMYCLIDYSNPSILYAEYQWGNLHKSQNNGNDFDYIGYAWEDDRVNWSAPLAMDPVNPQVLYFGTYRVWKSTNGGNSWNDVSGDITKGIDQYFHTVTTIAISSVNTDIIVAGTGDGLIHVSENAGLTWQNITNGIPDRWVTRVLCDPFEENTIYATVSGFRWDEYIPHVLKSTDLGQTWEDISSNLPELPVNDIVADPDYPGNLYVATDAGVYFSENNGQSWMDLNDGIYGVPVVALKVHAPTRALVAGTYGVSAYRLDMDDLITGMENKAENGSPSFTAYPNPVRDQLTLNTKNVTVNDPGDYIATVYDESGKLIVEAKVPGNLDFTRFERGVYFLKIKNNAGQIIQTEKIVKL